MPHSNEHAWHHMDGTQAIATLQSHADTGLDDVEVIRRRQQYGPNVLTPRHGHGPLVRFLLQFHQPLIYIMLGASLVTLLLEEYIDSAVIFGVVFVNAVIGFIQEARALKAIGALAQTLVTEATVVRKGRKTRVNSADIVPGDIVFLQSGDKVPADLRLVRCRDLRIAEAALTGESVPVEKAEPSLNRDTPLADRTNMAYGSTLVTFGQGTGVVVATGDRSEVGRISHLIATADDIQTPLTRRIEHFSKVLLIIILALAAVNFGVGILRGAASVTEMFMASVALAVAAIPEGLPAAVTITLAIGVGRMARRRTIIRKLPAVETLGGTTVICSDKTGTLTENQMTVTALFGGHEEFIATGVGYKPEGDIKAAGGETISIIDLHRRVALLEILRAGLCCNDSQLVQTGAGWEIQGDPTEGALLVVAAKARLDAQILREEFPRLDSIPFESEHQYMATLHDQGIERPRLIYAKGSVEAILRRSESMLDSTGQPLPLDRERIQGQVARLAAQGLRVLAFARKEVSPGTASLGHADVEAGMVFVGLQAMIDPPRAEAIQAVRSCQSAGIRVKMITGDHALTASAIAGQLGLHGSVASGAGAAAVTGQELEKLSEAEVVEVAERTTVFARVAPEQKLRLVRALQARGHVVAMTGDGVNDAPALKQANIGVAMGKGGTDVAREAADMVLTDDNFASIEAAVEEGRGVFDNLTKFIVWTLPTNMGEGLVILVAVLLGSRLPIAPVQILWINMMTAITLGLMLAFEPKEPGIMARLPRNPDAPILSTALLKRVGLVSMLLLIGSFGLFEWMEEVNQSTLAEAQTVAANVIVVGEIFYLFNCRSLTRSMFHIGLFSNKAAIGGAIGMLIMQILFSQTTVMNQLFHTAPISLEGWLIILAFGLLIYVAVEIEKHFVGHTLQGDPFQAGASRVSAVSEGKAAESESGR